MMKTEQTFLPSYHLDFDPVKNSFSKVAIAIDQRNYGQAVEFASVTIRQVQQLVLAIVLKHRAYACGMQGKFDEAVEDAQRAISYQPTLAMGYLQLGNIYRMQGKQLRAIDTFKMGLQYASADSPEYTLMMEEKEAAVKQSERRVDCLAKLPSEIADDVIALLSQEHKSACVSVSTVWRTKVLECSKAWSTFTGDDHTGDDRLTVLLPFFAAHVKQLTITTSNKHVWKRYLFGMMNKNFSKIQALELRQNAMKYITANEVTPVRHAFYGLNVTLTKVVISHNMAKATVTISDLLYGLSNLRCLVYSTISRLSDSMGSFPLPIPHDALVDLQLYAKPITQVTLVPLLQHCTKLRRLVLDGCITGVLDAIDAENCPNLTILGYNSLTVPTPALDQENIKQSCSGLEKFYTMNHGDRQSATDILSLIRRNMASLKEIYSNISARECHDLLTTYADINLRKIEKLIFWGYDSTVIQPLLLRSISSSTTLSHLSAMVSYDASELAHTLRGIPHLASLSLSHISAASASTNLVDLFETYTMDDQPKRHLTSIRLSYCAAITDDVLAALARIHSLKDIGLTGLRSVSANGIDNFFRSLSSSKNISYISLSEMDAVTDEQLAGLGAVKSLRHIHLDALSFVTNQGIIRMIDQMSSLYSLTLSSCGSITESDILYAKQKVKKVVVVVNK